MPETSVINSVTCEQGRPNWVDERTLPQWGPGPDGRMTQIGNDARLPGLFARWQEDACRHTSTVYAQQNDSLGRPQLYAFCAGCGMKVSSAVARSKVGDDVGSHDHFAKLNDHYIADREARLNKIIADAAERAQAGNREAYDDYLRSPDWKRRAAKVMQRAAGTCEGCLTNTAEHVHHLTYEHIGAEFAFELVALCAPCHHRLHQPNAA